MRYRIDLEYDGRGFAGWQSQPNHRTVQGEVEAAIVSLFEHAVRVEGAGRTDSGVSARQQVAAFDSPLERPPDGVRAGLNTRLPPDVACVAAFVVPPDFSPRRAPHAKTYRYTWLVRPSRPALQRGFCWHERKPLDVSAMHAAASCIIGTHDFTSFRAAQCASTHPVRTMEDARVYAVDDEVRFEVVGTGFLQHMVRILAGSLLEVGRGRRSAAWFASVLAARDRSRAARTAPAEGLMLQRIVYRDGPPSGPPDAAPTDDGGD